MGLCLLGWNDWVLLCVLEFYDPQGRPVTVLNDRGANIGNDIVIAVQADHCRICSLTTAIIGDCQAL